MSKVVSNIAHVGTYNVGFLISENMFGVNIFFQLNLVTLKYVLSIVLLLMSLKKQAPYP